jgi:hypothetical protein
VNRLARRWGSWSPARRILLAVVALVGAVNVVLIGARWALGPGPRGEPFSSYSTTPEGVAAYADLLERQGRQVQRSRTSLDRTSLEPGSTLILLNPFELEEEEPEAIRAFVERGGHLLAAGPTTAPLLRHLLGEDVVWSARRIARARPVAPVPETLGLRQVRADDNGSWQGTGPGLPVLAEDEDVLAAVATTGKGRVVLLAAASVLQNRLLVSDDNAAFGLAAAGPPDRLVVFAEAAHGYSEDEGLAAVPGRWKLALGGSALAVLVWMWSRGRRFGPPEERARDLAPPRRAYVDALATTLSRTRQPGPSVEPLRREARRRLAGRAGVSPDADDETLAEAARRLGAPAEAVAALVSPVVGDEDVMKLGRAAVWARESRW